MGEILDLGAVCASLGPVVEARVTSYCRDPELAEESTQEALARLVARIDELRDPDRLGGWITRVAINHVNSHYRHAAVQRKYAPRLVASLRGDGGSLEEAVATRDLLAVLTARQRHVIWLRFYEGLSVREAAQALACREGTVKSLTHRAIARLREEAA